MASRSVEVKVEGDTPWEIKVSLDVSPQNFVRAVRADVEIGESVTIPLNKWKVYVVNSFDEELSKEKQVPDEALVSAMVGHGDVRIVLTRIDVSAPGESPQKTCSPRDSRGRSLGLHRGLHFSPLQAPLGWPRESRRRRLQLWTSPQLTPW
jgi:hypothetical protein